MDEVRIWNVSLKVDQIRQTMNQEITTVGSNVQGAIIPKNISGLSWSNLLGYYQMNASSDIENGYLLDISTNSINGKLKNIYTQQPETAPIPYTSRSNGNWETDNTWTNYPVWDVPNSNGIDGSAIDWNIVITSHNIISNGNKMNVTSNNCIKPNAAQIAKGYIAYYSSVLRNIAIFRYIWSFPVYR